MNVINNAYQLSKAQLFEKLHSSDSGLTPKQSEEKLQQYGQNKLTPKQKVSPFKLFFDQFKNTLTIILIISAFLIYFIYFFGGRDPSDLIEAGLIIAIVVMIATLGFVQEYKAEKAIESLKKLLAFKTKVRREGKELEINVENLVPGDIVVLEEGTKIPSDIRLLEVFSLTVNESSLTGESAPVSKNAESFSETKQISDQKNMVFSGTSVASGRAIGIVIKTGDLTEIGKIAKDVMETKKEQTPIQKRLDQIGKVISFVILGVCSLVFIFIMFFAKDFVELPLLQRIIHSFIAAVALAVAAIPEGLPAVVTISLALGTQRMLKKNVLIRKLNSVETLGSTDVICSDKTGTLTKGEMTVKEIYFDGKIYEISGIGYETTGDFKLGDQNIDPKTFNLLLEIGLECNNASLKLDGSILGDPTEGALIISALKAKIENKSPRISEIPFSSERKMMTVVVQKNDQMLLYTKGAPEKILSKCSKIIINGEIQEISEKLRSEILQNTHKMSQKALRNLAFAYRPVTEEEYKKLSQDQQRLESGLIFVGIQGMIDPPRVEVKPLIEKCRESGIRVIMITGDHVETAKAVAHEIGITGEALSGEELDKLSDEEFKNIVEKVSIYARVSPNFKMRIVDALKHHGHIVAMTGDGVNDAPALKKADIGIAMGITGTDVAKEASDMVLLDDHFSSIIAAIEEGRGIFHNIRKFVTYLLSCNIGEVMVVFLAIMIFQELPLTALMLLWVNIVTDGIPAIALGLDPPEKGILKYSPKLFQGGIITLRSWVEMITYGLLLTIAVLGIFYLNSPHGLAVAQGAAFTALVIFELIDIYVIRGDYKTSFFSNKWLFTAVIFTLIVQIIIIYTPISKLFGISAIDSLDWAYIAFASILIWIVFKIFQKITLATNN